MPKHDSSCFIKQLDFVINNVNINVGELGEYVAKGVDFNSEYQQEEFAHYAAHQIYNGMARKVQMATATAERARIKRLWKKLHPPNHAGYYYCHIGGEWVHEDMAELEHIVASSIERINTDEPGWDEKLRMACHIHNANKGSSTVESKTLEIAPPDFEL